MILSHLYVVVIGLDSVNECSEAGFTHGAGRGNLGPLYYAAEAETMCFEVKERDNVQLMYAQTIGNIVSVQ